MEKDNRAVLSLFWQMVCQLTLASPSSPGGSHFINNKIVRFQLGSGVRAVFRGKGDEKDLNNLLASLRKNESERFHNLPAADVSPTSSFLLIILQIYWRLTGISM